MLYNGVTEVIGALLSQGSLFVIVAVISLMYYCLQIDTCVGPCVWWMCESLTVFIKLGHAWSAAGVLGVFLRTKKSSPSVLTFVARGLLWSCSCRDKTARPWMFSCPTASRQSQVHG